MGKKYPTSVCTFYLVLETNFVGSTTTWVKMTMSKMPKNDIVSSKQHWTLCLEYGNQYRLNNQSINKNINISTNMCSLFTNLHSHGHGGGGDLMPV